MQSVVIDVNHLLLDELSALRSLVGDRVAVSVSMTPHVAPVRIDPSALRKAILGLARNAAEAMSKGGTLVIETQNFRAEPDCDRRELAPGEYVCLNVSDTGSTLESIGSLPADCRAALRLAPVYAFAKRNGGTATVHNGSHGATKVSVYLPRASSDRSSIPVRDETDELRVELLRRRWQGIPHATPSASLAEDLASPRSGGGALVLPPGPAPTSFSRADMMRINARI
jgi:hypothetical protein